MFCKFGRISNCGMLASEIPVESDGWSPAPSGVPVDNSE